MASLVSTLMSGAAGIGGTVDTSKYDGMFGIVTESAMIGQELALLEGIYVTDRAVATADIIASVQVVTEGANGQVLFENVITSGIAKLKEYWLKFYAAAKKFFLHVIDVVKAMFMDGKTFANRYGKQIKEKIRIVKTFKVKVWEYKIDDGDKYVQQFADKANEEANAVKAELLPENDGPVTLSGKYGKSEDDLVDASDYLEDFIKKIDSSCTTVTEIAENARDKYLDNSKEKSSLEWKSTDVDAALKVLTENNKTVDSIKNDWNKQDKNINAIIKALDKLADKTAKENDDDGNKRPDADVKHDTNVYSVASAGSKICSSLLQLGRQMTSLKVKYHQDRYKAYTAILKSFFSFKREKAATEGLVLEGDEDCDFDMEGIEEAAIAPTDEPEGDVDDIGIVTESSMLTEAYRLLGI